MWELKDDDRGLFNAVRRFFGFYSNPPYIANELHVADVRSAFWQTSIVSCLEIGMILRYVINWVLPGKVASVGDFFHYTSAYWQLLAASLILLVYSVLYLNNKLSSGLKKISWLVILLYFIHSMYFGFITGLHDFSRGRMILCFLSMLMSVTVICIWRPFTSLLLSTSSCLLFVYLLNNHTFDKAGNPLYLSEGDAINLFTFMVTLFVLEIAVYNQRYSDAKKSWKLELASITDDLTGLPNMRKFNQAAIDYTDQLLKEGTVPLYLVLGIDNFRTYNDRFGYDGGDALLTRVGRMIQSTFPGEPVARESGSTFCVLTTAQDVAQRAGQIQDQIRSSYPTETYLTLGVGAYHDAQASRNPRTCVDRAHHALGILRQKRDESTLILEYSEKMHKDYTLKQYVLNHLEEAIREGYIQVYYQPVTWSSDGTLAGCEALARWIDPNVGFLSPGLFIPTLEESRQIHKLDLCIYESVCRRIRDCLDNGLPVLPTSMNFSRLDFELMDAVGELENLVAKYQIPREYLHVEITESAVTEDVAGLKKDMQRLHDLGYVIWLDDFGSGYSSMNVLKDFEFDLLKIDMEFLKNFSGNQNSRKIISRIIDLADDLGMLTLSEGVETQEAVDFLREAGCGRMQGYLFGKPMPYEELLSKITEGSLTLAPDSLTRTQESRDLRKNTAATAAER